MGLGGKKEGHPSIPGFDKSPEMNTLTPEKVASLAMKFVIEFHRKNNDPLGKGPELYKEFLTLYFESKGVGEEPDLKAAREWYLNMASVVTPAPNDIMKEAEAVKKYIVSTLSAKS